MFYARFLEPFWKPSWQLFWKLFSWQPWVKQTWSNQTWLNQIWTIQMWPGTIPFTVSRDTESLSARGVYYACGVNGFNIPVNPTLYFFVFQLPFGFRNSVEDKFSFIPVRKTQAGVP